MESDHKPLESIKKKTLAAAPPRLQRMILQLQRYEFTIRHRAGKDIPVADTLSRKPISDCDNSLSEGMDVHVHTVCSSLPVSDKKLQEIKMETEKDPQLQLLVQTLKEGWPEERRCPAEIMDYWNHRDELTVMHDIIFKGEKIIIPLSLRPEMLSRFHSAHMGIEKCKQRALDKLFWPGMNKQIEELVSKSSIYLEHRPSNNKEPMISHQVPDRPWQINSTDLFVWNNDNYFIIVDYYSRYFELEKLNSITSATIINKLKVAFARHGIPATLISDNGPQYRCKEFEIFSNTWDFHRITTSPYHPQSNGLAEKTVQIAKSLLKKAKANEVMMYI